MRRPAFALEFRDDIADHVVPCALGNGTIDPHIAQNNHLVFEDGDKDQDSSPVAGHEDFFLEKTPLGALPCASLEGDLADDPPTKAIRQPDHQSPGRCADKDREHHPQPK